MFGKHKKEREDVFSVESENLAFPEIHVHDAAEQEASADGFGKNEADCIPNVLETIAKRCSVRSFTNQEISDADVQSILEAGMSGPSACDKRDWSFVVIRDRKTLNAMADINSPSADPLRGAAMGILVCGDLEKAFEAAKEFWIIDGAIACQNMILAAKGLGIGSVWLGTWPIEARVRKLSKLFLLPPTQVPHSIIAFGYGAETVDQTKDTWDETVVHYEKW